jgi:hypothetical protein
MPYLKYSKNEAIVPKVHFSVPEVYKKTLYLRYRFTTKKSTKKDSPDDIHQSKIVQKICTTKDSRAKIQPFFTPIFLALFQKIPRKMAFFGFLSSVSRTRGDGCQTFATRHRPHRVTCVWPRVLTLPPERWLARKTMSATVEDNENACTLDFGEVDFEQLEVLTNDEMFLLLGRRHEEGVTNE